MAAGHEEWGRGGPHDAGEYKQMPDETGFFRHDGTWSTEYGRFFLEWYSGMLLEHGDRVLAAAEAVFGGTGATLSAKVAGIHWHYGTRSHAAELTAGYYNTRHRDGYAPIARMLAKRGAVLNFTCMEMKDEQQRQHANCSPEQLVRQVKAAASAAGVELAGENALERYDEAAFSQVVVTTRGAGLAAFTVPVPAHEQDALRRRQLAAVRVLRQGHGRRRHEAGAAAVRHRALGPVRRLPRRRQGEESAGGRGRRHRHCRGVVGGGAPSPMPVRADHTHGIAPCCGLWYVF